MTTSGPGKGDRIPEDEAPERPRFPDHQGPERDRGGWPVPDDEPPEPEPDRDAIRPIDYAHALALEGRMLDSAEEAARSRAHLGATMVTAAKATQELLAVTKAEYARRARWARIHGAAAALAGVLAVALFVRAESRARDAMRDRAAIRSEVGELREDVDALHEHLGSEDDDGGAWASTDQAVWTWTEGDL